MTVGLTCETGVAQTLNLLIIRKSEFETCMITSTPGPANCTLAAIIGRGADHFGLTSLVYAAPLNSKLTTTRN
jgi:hypothetical protein